MSSWLRSTRGVLTIVASLLVVLAGAGYLFFTVSSQRVAPVATSAEVQGRQLQFVELADGRNRVQTVSLADPAGPRGATPLACQRVYSAAGTTVCLRLSGLGPSYSAEIMGRDATLLRSVGLPGIPSRAKVSTSGQMVTWTSFVTGDSYTVPGGFSTRTGYFDLRSGTVVESLEHFTADIEGTVLTAQDINYWGMTVADDDRTFYATLASGGRTWLVRGDLVTSTVRSVRGDAECPSLSPDGTKVAYKKRIGRFGPWDLAVLDLATGQERRLPGTAGIDDQATWLDNERLAFAAVPRDARVPAIHVVPSDGSAPASILIPEATSPSPAG